MVYSKLITTLGRTLRARLREAWQAMTTAEMREHYLRSMAEGISNLPEAEGLPFGDEEFDPEASG